MKIYDGSNKYNPHSLELDITNTAFGIDAMGKDPMTGNIEQRPFLFRSNRESAFKDSKHVLSVDLAIGNMVHKKSDLPAKEIDDTDLHA